MGWEDLQDICREPSVRFTAVAPSSGGSAKYSQPLQSRGFRVSQLSFDKKDITADLVLVYKTGPRHKLEQ